MSRADGVLCKVPQAASSLGLYADSPPHHLFHLVAFLFSYTPDQLKLSPTGRCHCQFYLQRRPPFFSWWWWQQQQQQHKGQCETTIGMVDNTDICNLNPSFQPGSLAVHHVWYYHRARVLSARLGSLMRLHVRAFVGPTLCYSSNVSHVN